MVTRKMSFPRKTATVESVPRVKVKFKNVDVGNGFIVDVPNATKSTLQQAYRAIKKEIAARRDERYRIIWLIKSFLVYRYL